MHGLLAISRFDCFDLIYGGKSLPDGQLIAFACIHLARLAAGLGCRGISLPICRFSQLEDLRGAGQGFMC